MATAPRSRSYSSAERTRARSRAPHARAMRQSAPTQIDQRRYFDFRAGMSAAELAARENVQLATIENSLTRMRSHASQFSQEAAEIATRQLYLDRLPDANHVFAEALTATKTESRVELVEEYNLLTDRKEFVEKTILDHVPDHATRLKATDALQRLLAGIQPKQPLVAVDARSQTNIGYGGPGQPALGPGSQHPGTLSSESIIRQLRLERGLAVPGIDTSEPTAAEPVPIEVDTELADDLEDDDDIGDGEEDNKDEDVDGTGNDEDEGADADDDDDACDDADPADDEELA